MKLRTDPYHELIRDLDDGRSLYVRAMTFGKFRLNIGPTGEEYYDDGW